MTCLICTPRVVDAVIASTFDGPLVQAGFAKVSNRRYVRERIRCVREVFEFRSTAVSLIPVWGFSFDFVPHIAGRDTETVRWHRTAKSANPDLRYSGLGRFGCGPREPGAEICFSRGEVRFRQEAAACKHHLLPVALAQLDSVCTLGDFHRLFAAEAREDWFFNLTQLSLAYAFYLANIGDENRARSYMSAWLRRSSHRDETQQQLAQLFEAAVHSPAVVQ